MLLFIRSGFVCNINFGRRLLSNASTANVALVVACADPRYVNIQHAPVGFDTASAVVYPGFITEVEETTLVEEAGRRLIGGDTNAR